MYLLVFHSPYENAWSKMQKSIYFIPYLKIFKLSEPITFYNT
jgi:hypothetical protein